MYCISINYKNADITLREKLALTKNAQRELISGLVLSKAADECIILCTCNRTEIYFCGGKGCESTVIEALAEASEIDGALLAKILMLFMGDGALRHLMRVVCGIDSMVIGEDEILGQTKDAYMFAKESGCVGRNLNIIFQSAFACAKRVKTDTLLSKTSVSVATLAANEAAKFKKNVTAMVIGASGRTGSMIVKNLASHKNTTVIATLRNHTPRIDFMDNPDIRLVDYSERYSYFPQCDCVISATSSPHYTVTAFDSEKHLSDGKERLFIDLAVPPDIDREISAFEGVSLINIDYIEQLAAKNNEIKMHSIDFAEKIIAHDIDELKKNLLFHDVYSSLKISPDGLSAERIKELIYKMKSEASFGEFRAFIGALKNLLDEV